MALADKPTDTSVTSARRTRIAAHATGLSLAVVYVAILLATSGDVGFARDEGFYFTASEQYMRWFDAMKEDRESAMTQPTVDRFWRINSEHPPLMKVLFGLSWKLFSQKLDWMNESTAFRFPGMVMGGLLLYLVVLFGTSIGGLRVGIFAALALALMPRFFYHAHLNCFDVPITTMWFAVVFAFVKSLRSWGWGIVTGVLWGLALATKLNSFFIPVVLLAFWAILYLREFATAGHGNIPGKGRIKLPGLPVAFFAMLLIGPLVLYALWPWLWFDTIERFGGYMGFHKHHPYYNIEYLGYTHFEPPFPFSYPFVMTLVTIPLVTTAMAILGMGDRLVTSLRRMIPGLGPLTIERQQHEESIRGTTWLLFLNMLVPMLIIAWKSTPIFGGTKHWMPAWPYIALFAGFGFCIAADGLSKLMQRAPALIRSRLGGRHVVAVALGALLLAPAAQQTEISHPFGLSHYTMPIGETPGSATVGMCRQYWGFTTGSALDWLNDNVQPRQRVFFHDTAWDSYNMFKRDGDLRHDVLWHGQVEGSDVAMVHWEQHMAGYEYAIWTTYGTVTPAHVVTHQGVPILILYKKQR